MGHNERGGLMGFWLVIGVAVYGLGAGVVESLWNLAKSLLGAG